MQPEENHGNLRALGVDCIHWYSKRAYIGNSYWEKSRRTGQQRTIQLISGDIIVGVPYWRNWRATSRQGELSAYVIMRYYPPTRLRFSNGIFPWGLRTIPSSALGSKPCNVTCLAWCTFLHVAMGSHLPCSLFLLHGRIVLPAFVWILLDLTQLRHAQLVLPCNWGHAPSGMSALHRGAPHWPAEESVAPSTPGRCWSASSGTLNRADLSQTLSNLCTRYRVVTNPLRSLPLLLKVFESALWVGRSLCSSAAVGVMGGTAEDHATALDDWKLSRKTLHPPVRLSVTHSQKALPLTLP
jgi:hypothetical protein